MSISSVLPARHDETGFAPIRPQTRGRRAPLAPAPFHFPGNIVDLDAPYRSAELFYLQKQIQTQTPMVVVLEDGELIEGCIEWYDRNTLKVRGRWKTLIYKSAIKYMYKVSDTGRQPVNS
ncbi:MAG: Hfq-like protein [Terriglobia bacterium]